MSPFHPSRLPVLLLLFSFSAGCPGEPEVPSETELAKGRIVVGQEHAAGAAGQYLYLVKRGAVVMGLADQRRMGLDVAKDATRKAADVLEACLAEQIPRGAPTRGAARAVVKMSDDGDVLGVAIVLDDPGDAPLVAVTLRCLKAPLSLMAFPPADADAGAGQDRGFALEALWGGS